MLVLALAEQLIDNDTADRTATGLARSESIIDHAKV